MSHLTHPVNFIYVTKQKKCIKNGAKTCTQTEGLFLHTQLFLFPHFMLGKYLIPFTLVFIKGEKKTDGDMKKYKEIILLPLCRYLPNKYDVKLQQVNRQVCKIIIKSKTITKQVFDIFNVHQVCFLIKWTKASTTRWRGTPG